MSTHLLAGDPIERVEKGLAEIRAGLVLERLGRHKYIIQARPRLKRSILKDCGRAVYCPAATKLLSKAALTSLPGLRSPVSSIQAANSTQRVSSCQPKTP